MRRSSRRGVLGLAVVVLVAIVAAVVVIVTRPGPVPPVAAPPPGPPERAPDAVVSLGDSTIAGQGAGHYVPGTNGENGDWCHRSKRAEITQVAMPGVTKKINLACSGADSSDVSFGGDPHYTEGSQAARLSAIARKYRVRAVLLSVGANDDPQFADTLTRCVRDWLERQDCFGHFDKEWHERVRRMRPKVAGAIADIRTAMRRAHYDDSDYSFVLQSYAAPLGPDVPPDLQDLSGCPLRTPDLRWIRDTGVKVLDDGLRAVAENTGVRFLDLARAGVGHEACSGGNDPSSEWFNRLTVDWHDLLKDTRASHALEASFHPNARGYRQFAGCLTEFLATDIRTASCVAGDDGDLHAAHMLSAR